MSMAGFHSLRRPVRPQTVFHVFGQLSLAFVGLCAVPAAVAAVLGEWDFAGRCAAMTLLCLAASLWLRRLAAPTDIRGNEALVVIALVFLSAALLMTWPFMAAGIAPVDAFFETVSGITTTGLSILPTTEGQPAGFLFARAWMQWYGGLTIVALSLAFTIGPGPAARRLAGVEGAGEDLAASTRVWARRALAIFAALTVAGIVILLPFGLPLIDTVTHVLAGVSTGGFSTRDGSIAALGGRGIQTILLLLGLAGAISFTLYDRLWHGRWRAVAGDVELRALLVAVLLVALLLAVSQAIVAGRSWQEAIVLGPLLALSAQTTTGFASTDVAVLDAASKVVLIVSMFIGGDAGSTAGGIKIIRLLLILRLMQLVILRAMLPRGSVLEISVGGRRFGSEDLITALGIVSLYVGAVLVTWLAFLLAGAAPLDALFDVVSAYSTTGLSTGIAGPDLAPWLKGLLCAGMLMGRLEIVALLVLVLPPSWRSHAGRTA